MIRINVTPDSAVIDIENGMPHVISEVICVRCCRRWLAVRPEGTLLKDMECPGCHKTGAVIETGEEIDEEGQDA